MNSLAASLNSAVASQPLVFSLHDLEGRVVQFFSSCVPQTIAEKVAYWGPRFEMGYTAICWRHGLPDRALGRGGERK